MKAPTGHTFDPPEYEYEPPEYEPDPPVTLTATSARTILETLRAVDEFLRCHASAAVRAELRAFCAAQGWDPVCGTDAFVDGVGLNALALRWALDAAAPTGTAGPSRDDPATMTCPVCRASFAPTGRQRYCGPACRKTAFRRRHTNPPITVIVPAVRGRRQATVYECPDCGERLLGEQRCQPCGVFTRRVGLGGACPDCDAPLALADLLDHETTITATTGPKKKETP
jgi:predicted RNA-binding Zn-ribbon protein involved in translation (DUF1610 family)